MPPDRVRKVALGAVPKFDGCAYLTSRVRGEAPRLCLDFSHATLLAKALRADNVVYRTDLVVKAAERAREEGFPNLTLEAVQIFARECEEELENVRRFFLPERCGPRVMNPAPGLENTSLLSLLSSDAERFVIDLRDVDFDRPLLRAVTAALEGVGEVWFVAHELHRLYDVKEVVIGSKECVESLVRATKLRQLYTVEPGAVVKFRERGAEVCGEVEFFEEGKGYLAEARSVEPLDYFELMTRGLPEEVKERVVTIMREAAERGGIILRDATETLMGSPEVTSSKAIAAIRRLKNFGYVEEQRAAGAIFLAATDRLARWYVEYTGAEEAEEEEAAE